ncbi:hypothetical protein [uncultured Cardiobacterium sp.]|uniref:hypothetical protein n=1 Tax=uncultured Cardiobacterium sp. TaxID=417619 RepID=UPI002609768E|nr:hypothetical protein [uncultured Cardiobacterium sp.]
MKKILTLILLGIVIIATALGTYLYAHKESEIPNETVITAIKARFPIELSLWTSGETKLSHPDVHIENSEIIIETDYAFTGAAQSGTVQAQAVFTARLDYRKGNLYLLWFELKKLSKDGQEIKADPYAVNLINAISHELQYKKPLLYLGDIVGNPASIDDVKIKNGKVIIEKKRMRLW